MKADAAHDLATALEQAFPGFPLEMIEMALEQICEDHLTDTAPFPPEMLDLLCRMYLEVAAFARAQLKPDMPGVRAGRAADLLTAIVGMSDRRAQKTVADRLGIPFETVRQAHRRLRKKQGRGQKRP